MKFVFILALTIFSMSSFAQDRCELRVQRLQERISELSARLRSCETSNPNRGEIEFLRNENFRLTEDNRQLQRRIDELEGRTGQKFFCSVGCVSPNGEVDNRFLSVATAFTQVEADFLAKQELKKNYTCNFGIKTYKCDSFNSEEPRNFCTAACVSPAGVPDQRYLAGARGRSLIEAEVLAIKEVQKSYSCNFGIKMVSCN